VGKSFFHGGGAGNRNGSVRILSSCSARNGNGKVGLQTLTRCCAAQVGDREDLSSNADLLGVQDPGICLRFPISPSIKLGVKSQGQRRLFLLLVLSRLRGGLDQAAAAAFFDAATSDSECTHGACERHL
jgi:hypothetical protein